MSAPPLRDRKTLALFSLLVLTNSVLLANPAVDPVPRPGEWWETLHPKYVARAQAGDIGVLFLGDSITQYWEDANPAQAARPSGIASLRR